MSFDRVSGETQDPVVTPKKLDAGGRTDLERALGRTQVSIAALAAALDAMGTPAFVLRQTAEIVYTNRLGLRLLEQNRRCTSAALRAALAGHGERYLVTELTSRGAPGHFLIVQRPPPAGVFDRAAAAGARWSLTPRQREVLAHVASGKCNKTIAAELGCAERTVELHVTACLEKARCGQRAELVAKVWGLP
jgi:DNA-binding CsgD family transcriptional regulator